MGEEAHPLILYPSEPPGPESRTDSGARLLRVFSILLLLKRFLASFSGFANPHPLTFSLLPRILAEQWEGFLGKGGLQHHLLVFQIQGHLTTFTRLGWLASELCHVARTAGTVLGWAIRMMGQYEPKLIPHPSCFTISILVFQSLP